MSLHVVRILPSLDRIGPTQGTLNTLLKMEKSQVTTTVVVLGSASWGKYGYPKFSLEKEYTAAGIPTYNLQLKKPWDLFLAIPKLIHIFKKIQPDIVHTQLLRPDIYGRIAARILHIPVVSTIHNEDAWMVEGGVVNRLTRLIEAWTKKFVIQFIAVSETVKNFVVKYGKISQEKITVINNGVVLERFSQTRDPKEIKAKLGFSPDAKIVGTVARVDIQKDPYTVLDTAQKVLKQSSDVQFVWIGAGPMIDEIKQSAEERGIKDAFHFLGERTDIPELLQAIDIFFLLSKYEGMPNALLEAMASGRPCIATNVSGNRIALQDNVNGILVPVADSDAAASAIIKLLQQPEQKKRLGAAARKTIENTFSSTEIAKQYQSVYESVARLTKPSPQ